jgi:predicted metal-dependent HD superfamily phosphohydrolase
MRQQILNHLKANLSDELLFHDINHSLNVEKAVIRIGQLEGVTHEELMLMRTAALYHSVGYVYQYSNNKILATKFAQRNLPELGYTEKQVSLINSMILATDPEIGPKNLLEEIVCDADSDHIGRPDYFSVIQRLRNEMENFDQKYSDDEWMNLQLSFLENDHRFYTNVARNLRNKGKINRISELKNKLTEVSINKPLE